MWLFAMLIAVPLIEIALFVTVGGAIGLWATLAVVLGTGLLGSWVIRRQGMHVVAQVRSGAAHLASPMAHGALIVVAGMLLILPGFFTDTVGLLLLIAPLRRGLIATLLTRVRFQNAPMPGRGSARDLPIDGEYIELDAQQVDPPGKSGWTRH